MRANGILYTYIHELYSPSEMFVMLTADQFFGRHDGPLEQQSQAILICQRNCTFPLILRRNQCSHFKDDEE